jgi:hypothetical protein
MAYEPLEMAFQILVKDMDKEQLKSYAKWFAGMLPTRIKMLTAKVQSVSLYEKWSPDFSIASLDGLGNWFYEWVRNLPSRNKSIEEIQSLLENWFFNNVIPEVHGSVPDVIFADFQSWWMNKLGSNLEHEQAAELAMQWFHQNIAPNDSEEDSDYLAFENQWLTITHGQILDPICYSIFADIGLYLSEVFARYRKKNYPHINWHRSFGSLKYRHYYPHLHVITRNELMVDFDPITAVTDIGFSMRNGEKDANALKNLFSLWTDCIALYNKQMPILAELADSGVNVKSLWDFRYEENPNRRQLFSQAIAVLCRHLKEQKDPYILEAISSALIQDELEDELGSQTALEVLEKESSTLATSTRRFLCLAAMRDESLKTKADKYL